MHQQPAAHGLAAILAGSGLTIEPVPKRYECRELRSILPLAKAVLVGVDDIPTRWLVQRADPDWLGIGAATTASAMASLPRPGPRVRGVPLHPADDPGDAPIPTVAFVSFWTGLLTAGYFLRQRRQPSDAGRDTADLSDGTPPGRAVRLIVTGAAADRCPTCAVLREPVSGRMHRDRSHATQEIFCGTLFSPACLRRLK